MDQVKENVDEAIGYSPIMVRRIRSHLSCLTKTVITTNRGDKVIMYTRKGDVASAVYIQICIYMYNAIY